MQNIKPRMDKVWGDRAQEIVFIGSNTTPQAHAHASKKDKSNWKDEVKRALDACLLTQEEMKLGAEKWRALPDPFERCGWSAKTDRAELERAQAEAEQEADEAEEEEDDGETEAGSASSSSSAVQDSESEEDVGKREQPLPKAKRSPAASAKQSKVPAGNSKRQN